jgi:hypothetical protein
VWGAGQGRQSVRMAEELECDNREETEENEDRTEKREEGRPEEVECDGQVEQRE